MADSESIIRGIVSDEITKALGAFKVPEFPKIEPHHIGSCPSCEKALNEALGNLKIPEPKVEDFHHDLETIDFCPNCGPKLKERDMRNYTKGLKEAADLLKTLKGESPLIPTNAAVGPAFKWGVG